MNACTEQIEVAKDCSHPTDSPESQAPPLATPSNADLVEQTVNVLIDYLTGRGWVGIAELRECIPEELAETACQLTGASVCGDLRGPDRTSFGRSKLLAPAVKQLVAQDLCETEESSGHQEVRLMQQVKGAAQVLADTGASKAAPPPVAELPVPVAPQQTIVAADLPFHELANLFPLLEGAEYDRLKEDIREHGQREPSTTYQNKILDGRNRFRACQELGIAPTTREWDGKGSPLSFVVSQNLRRRHLDESQRALIAAKLKPLLEQEAKERMLAGKRADPMAHLPQGAARELAATVMGVSPRSVESASKVLKEGSPDLVQAVEKGEVKVSSGAELTKLSREEQNKILAAGSKEVKAKAKQIRQQKAVTKETKANKSGVVKAAPTKSATACGGGQPSKEAVLTLTADIKPQTIATELVRFLGQGRAQKVHEALGRSLDKERDERAMPAMNIALAGKKRASGHSQAKRERTTQPK